MITFSGRGDVIYGQKHFYIPYSGGQQKRVFEIKTEKLKILVTIAGESHREQTGFLTFDDRVFFKP